VKIMHASLPVSFTRPLILVSSPDFPDSESDKSTSLPCRECHGVPLALVYEFGCGSVTMLVSFGKRRVAIIARHLYNLKITIV